MTVKLLGADDATGSPNSVGYFTLNKYPAVATGNMVEFRVKSSAAGNIKVALYADSGGEPGALITAMNTGQAVVVGWNTLTFTSTAITNGTAYWLAYMIDTVGAIDFNHPGGSEQRRYKAATYAGWTFPDPAGSGFSSTTGYIDLEAGWGVTETAQKLLGDDTTTPDYFIVGGYVLFIRYQAVASGTCNKIKVQSSGSGNVKVAVYADSAGEPGSRLAKQDTSTAVVAGLNTIPLEASCPIVSGTYYWIAAIADAQILGYLEAGTNPQRHKAGTFSTYTFPDPAGTGYDTGTNLFIWSGWGGTEKTASDSGSGSESATLNKTMLKSDIGVGVDAKTSAPTAVLTRADVGIGVDAYNLLRLLFDSGVGLELPSVRGWVVVDSGIGADVCIALIATILKVESGVGVESRVLSVLRTVLDSAASSESKLLAAQLLATEYVSGLDLASVFSSKLVQDSGIGVDQLALRLYTGIRNLPAYRNLNVVRQIPAIRNKPVW